MGGLAGHQKGDIMLHPGGRHGPGPAKPAKRCQHGIMVCVIDPVGDACLFAAQEVQRHAPPALRPAAGKTIHDVVWPAVGICDQTQIEGAGEHMVRLSRVA